MNKDKPLVSIACITYNQAKYIRQCLEGFVMQQVDFPVEIVIHDDASTDGTQEIIKEYVEKYPQFKWVPILQTSNKYSEGKGILIPYVYPKCTGKYIALCEGDDYWIDPLKLQKQIDILEHNSFISIVYTNFYCVDSNGKQIVRPEYEKYIKKSVTGNVFERLIEGNFILTLTVCYRAEILKSVLYKEVPNSLDYSLFLATAAFGKAFYIKEKTGCYRYTGNGVTTLYPQKILNILFQIQAYYTEKALDGLISLKIYEKIKLCTYIVYMALNQSDFRRFYFRSLLKKHPLLLIFLPFGVLKKIKKS